MAVALSFFGSAILLFSCESEKVVPADASSLDEFMTEYSEQLSIIQSENNSRSYLFKAPVMEGYTLARDPYREFNRGIHITTFEDDSVGSVSATLTANYAIFYENRKLWEAKGDVVVIQADGRSLYTQQLFWNQATHRIYSNVDSKIVQGDEIYNCEGFESDEAMKEWSYRKLKGVTYFVEPETSDSLSSKSYVEDDSALRPNERSAQRSTTEVRSGGKVRVTKATAVVPGGRTRVLKDANQQPVKGSSDSEKVGASSQSTITTSSTTAGGTVMDINDLSHK